MSVNPVRLIIICNFGLSFDFVRFLQDEYPCRDQQWARVSLAGQSNLRHATQTYSSTQLSLIYIVYGGRQKRQCPEAPLRPYFCEPWASDCRDFAPVKRGSFCRSCFWLFIDEDSFCRFYLLFCLEAAILSSRMQRC